jgi:selenocysteine lyase/cysteine desulfurase
MKGNIRKFEEIGTHPAANHLAVAEALTFHQGIGSERKAARLVYLRDSWATRLLEHDRIQLHTSLREGFACGIATVEIEGVDTRQLRDSLWNRHRILTVAINHAQFRGLRISPSVYSTMEEVDRFVEAMEEVLRNGLPA